MCCAVLSICDLNSDYGRGAGAVLVVGVVAWGQLGGEWGVGGVREEGELELHFFTQFY